MEKQNRNLSIQKRPEHVHASQISTGATPALSLAVKIALVAGGIIYLATFVYAAIGASILTPYSDMVDLIDSYFRAVDQGKPLEYLLAPHNFHRLPWFRGLIALDVSLFRGTGLPLALSGLLCLTGTALLLMNEARRAATALAVPIVMIAGMLVFLTANAAGVSVPANTPHLHATFLSVLSLLSAASASRDKSNNWFNWASALACAVAASFSLATALVLWPILIIVSWRAKMRWQVIGVIAMVGGVFCCAYLMGESVGAPLQQGLDPNGLYKAGEYFVAYLGLPWVRGSKLMGEILGAAVLVISLFVLLRYGFRETTRTQRLALAMILFSLGSGVMAAVGRRDIALEVDIPLRYAILMAPLHVGLLLLAIPTIVRTWESRPRLVIQGIAAAFAFLLAQQVIVAVVAVQAAEKARHVMTLYQRGVRTPEMLQWVYPDLDRAADVYAEMRRRGVFLQWTGQLNPPAPRHIGSDGAL